jgi:hypothetical protein
MDEPPKKVLVKEVLKARTSFPGGKEVNEMRKCGTPNLMFPVRSGRELTPSDRDR